MKKYLSMKYLVGIFALLAVLGMQSFQKAQEKQAKAETEEMIWFPANNPEEHSTECDLSEFNRNNGTAVQPDGCDETKSYCCAVGYPEGDCDEIAPGVYQLKPSITALGQVIRFDE